MERENCYVLLELAFDPPVNDTTAIKAAIHKKRQEWVRMQDAPGKRGLALHYLSLIPEIEQIMLDAISRKSEAEAAVAQRVDMLRQFEAELRVLESKGYVTPREAATITAKYSQYGIGKQELNDLARKPVSETPPKENTDGEMSEVLDRLTARSIQRNLELLGIGDLYAFLELPQYSSIKKLKDSAEVKRREAAANAAKNARNTAIQELSGICLQIFADFDSKQKYDRYLKISGYPAVGELLDEEFARSKYINTDVLLRIVNFAVEKYGCKVLEAEEYIRRYCQAYDIPVDTQSKLIECPACRNKTDREGELCAVCAAPLRGTCPNCSSAFENGPTVCSKCGFAISEMVKAQEYISEAENALIESNWSSAQRCIAYAGKFWPGHPRLDSLERRAKRLEDRYASYVDNIGDCARHLQYYAAMELIEEAQARRIRLPQSTTSHVEKVISDFEEKLEQVTSSGQSPDFDKIYDLANIVADSIELGRLLALHPPEPVPGFTVTVSGRSVRVEWEKSPARGVISYVLVRKRESEPLTAYDGDILYEGMANSFDDLTAAPLKRFYYSVYVRRGNAYSESAVISEPVLIIPEVENLRLVPTDSGARASWSFNPDLREVLVWRKLGGDRPLRRGDGMLLENPRLDGFSDSKLKNDVEYWYFILSVYIIDGVRVFSKGVCDSIVPHKLLAPIEHVDIARVDGAEGEYVLNWHNSQYKDVLVLASVEKPGFKTGETFPASELIEKYRNLDLDAKTPESARFHCQFSGGLYIFAAAISGKYATVGSPRYVTNVLDVEELTWDEVGSDLVFNMKWPADVDEILVEWRFDGFPKAPGEPGASSMVCTREQYDYDAGVIVKDPERSLYYFKIFSVFKTPAGDKSYSPGAGLRVDITPRQEVFYQLKYSKPFFASAYVVSLTISSNEEITLPRSVVVGKIGRLPLRKTDGMPLFEIEKEIKVTGSVTYEYRTSLLPKDLYVKLFLRDDAMYDKIRLLPVASLKIT